jgi:signal transduction histidine kinase/DNA-binding response OmpR family regulator
VSKLQPANILVIDDDQAILGVVELLLSHDGHQVKTLQNVEAIRQFLTAAGSQTVSPYDLVLLDLRMPHISGEEIFEHLRQIPATADIPILILSASVGIESQVKLLSLGADGYLTKPFMSSELSKQVAVHLQLGQHRRARREAEALIERQNKQLAAAAAENAFLLEREQQRRQQAEKLYQMTQLISSLEVEKVLSTAVASLGDIVRVENSSILLLDETLAEISIAGQFDSGQQLQHSMRLATDEAIVAQVVQSGQPVSVNHATGHPTLSARVDRRAGQKIRSFLCIPLIAHNQVIGVIELLNKRNGIFLDDDLTLAASAAGAIAIALDNAQLYRQQSELLHKLRLSQEQLLQSEKMAATGRLAASLAHEINNPLQAIHSCLQLAINFPLSAEKRSEYLIMANEEVERLADLVSRILEFARLSGGAPQALSVNKIVGQVMNLANKYVQHNNHTVQQILASDIPAIRAVPNEIGQVFLQLMLNAFDAMPEPGTLTIRTRTANDWVEVAFQDNGIGMSPAVLERIFEPFYTTKPNNTGLGLTTSYTIIERHGGTFQVESEPGKGSTITVRLPRMNN